MTGRGEQPPGIRLLGRERECLAIDRLLDDARAGAGGALVVRGEAGIGKSSLLDHAVQRAAPAGEAGQQSVPMTVLSAVGVEAESDLAFAGLYGLLRPALGCLRELPDTQSRALAGALGLAPAAQADRLLISAAVLGLLAAAAEGAPVLVVVDDAQWVDRPSADALVFVARRLRAERLAMLFGAREGEVSRFETAGLPELTLGGLGHGPAAAILATSARQAVPGVRDRLLAEADGNPLALLELPDGLSAEQLTGLVPLPEAMPLTPRLEGVFRQRIGRLPPAARTALLIAAADNTGDVTAVLRAAAALRLTADALDPAEQAALIRILGTTITFRHPLVRSALYQSATLSERQRVHAALAGALSGEEDTDRRVWHQAMATLTGDEEVAAALEASARRAQLRAGHASAATAFLRAAELSTDGARRVHRMASAAQAAWDAGQPARARDIIGRALPSATGQTRAWLLHLGGVIEFRTGSMREACTWLLQGADASAEPSRTLEMLIEASEAATMCGDSATSIRLAARAADFEPATPRDRLMAAMLDGYAKGLAGDHEGAQARLAKVQVHAATVDDPRALVWASGATAVAGDAEHAVSYANRAVEEARRQGLLSLLPGALEEQALVLIENENFDLGYAAAVEGYRLSLDVGHGSGWHLMNMAMVEAVRGDEAARSHAEEARSIGQRTDSAPLTGYAEKALGFLDLTLGRAEQAADRLMALITPGNSAFSDFIAAETMPDAVEAAARAGRHPVAAERLEAFRGWVTAAPTQGRRALLARCEALIETRDPEEAFGEALGAKAALPPLQGARTELLYGEWLRRERRRVDARGHLRKALEAFRGLGAVPWAERAEAELRATGETVRKHEAVAVDRLTPQELQVAGLVTEGLTNKEIAAQLFLSPRTVDYHLRKVFTKLGIASRAELIRDGLPARDHG
jgi:DNA-binding CsgD family transcriptional regulator